MVLVMATSFDDIAGFVRTILGDHDSENFVYTQEAIYQHIRFQTMTQDNPGLQEDAPPNDENFTQTLEPKAKVTLILLVAKGLIVPVPNYFAYSNPVNSGTRSGHTVQILGWIDETLTKLQGGAFPVSCDDEMDAILLGPKRFLDQYNDTVSKMSL